MVQKPVLGSDQAECWALHVLHSVHVSEGASCHEDISVLCLELLCTHGTQLHQASPCFTWGWLCCFPSCPRRRWLQAQQPQWPPGPLSVWGLCNHATRGRTVIVPHSDPEEILNTGSAQYFAFPWIFQSKTTNIANAELYLARKWNQTSFWKQTLQCRAEWSSNMVCSSSAELRKNTLCESWKNRRILAKLPGFCPWAGDAAHGLSPCRWLPCMGFATLAMLSLVNVLLVWSLPAFPFRWTGSFQTKLFSLLLVAPLLLGRGGRSQRCTAASPLSPSLDVAPGPPSVPANPQKGSPQPVTPSPHSSAIIITPTINSSPTRWSH